MAKENETPVLDDEVLKQVLAEVEAGINEMVKSEKDKLEALAKAHPGEETPSEPQADTSATNNAPESSGPESAPPADAAPAEEPAAPTGEPEAHLEPDGDEGDPAEVQGPLDPQELKAMYCQLPVEDLEVHYLACKEALVEKKAAEQPVPAPAPAAAPAAPAASPAPAVAEKSEKDLKLEALEKKVQEDGELIGKLTEVVGKLASIPLRKSVSSLEQVELTDNKSELKNLKKSEIDAALMRAIATQSLTKSDGDLITAWELGKLTDVSKLEHIINKVSGK